MPQSQTSGHVPHRIEIITADHVTVAVVLPNLLPTPQDGKQHVPIGFGVARCHPLDEYNFEHGANLASARALADFGQSFEVAEQARIDDDCQRHTDKRRRQGAAQELVDEIKNMSAREVLEKTIERKTPKPSEKDPAERDAVEILVVARQLLQDERAWIKGRAFMLSPNPKELPHRFCSSGACDYASGLWEIDPAYPEGVKAAGLPRSPETSQAFNCLTAAARQMGRVSVIRMNDSNVTKHSDIMRLFDRAIVIAKERREEAAAEAAAAEAARVL